MSEVREEIERCRFSQRAAVQHFSGAGSIQAIMDKSLFVHAKAPGGERAGDLFPDEKSLRRTGLKTGQWLIPEASLQARADALPSR